MIKMLKKKYELIIMFIIGMVCIIFQKQIYNIFPLLFGLFLLERGINKCYNGYKNGDLKDRKGTLLEQGIIIVIVAIGIMIRQREALTVAATFWGISGLLKSIKYLNELFYQKFNKEKIRFSLLVAFIIELFLSLTLIFEPIGNIEHHILILGIQLIMESILGLLIKIKKDINEL